MACELDDDGLPIRLRKAPTEIDKTQRIKLVSCGGPGSGKTCLIKRFCEKRFVQKYSPTIGLDFGVTGVSVDGVKTKVSFYDLAGDPVYDEVRVEFYRDAQGLLLVFDVKNPASFKALEGWLLEIENEIDLSLVCVAVCANKSDAAADERRVSEAEARHWAESRGFHYYETSAESGDGVTSMFETTFGYMLASSTGRGVDHPPTPDYSQKHIDAIGRVQKSTSDRQLLGLGNTPSREEINKAYRTLAATLHPDKNRAPGSEEAFKALAAARTSLLMNAR